MLKVYDAQLKRAMLPNVLETGGLGNISAVMSATLTSKVNGDNALMIKARCTEQNERLLIADRLIAYDGQFYRIMRPEHADEREGTILIIEAPHIIYDLRDSAIQNIETKEDPNHIDGINQSEALQQVLDGTEFVPGACTTPEKTEYLDILEQSRMEALRQVLDKWGGELEADNFTLHIRPQIGDNRGVYLRKGKNADGINILEDISNVVTRLWVYGYQGSNFKAINEGKAYIDSPHIAKYANVKEGFAYFDDIEDAAELMRLAQEELAKRDKPLLSVRVNMAKLLHHPAYAELEKVRAGDTVNVYSERLAAPIPLRALEVETDCLTGQPMRMTLGDINKESMLFSFSDTVKTAQKISKTMNEQGKLKGQSIRGAIDLLQVQLRASANYKNAEIQENRSILLENNNEASPDYGAIYAGPGFLALANSKNEDGKWDWRTLATGKGFAGTEILAHTISAEKLRGDVGKTLDISSNHSILMRVDRNEFNERLSSEIQQRDNSIRIAISQEKERAETVENELKKFVEIAQTFFNFGVDGLSVGKTGSIFKTLQSDTKMSFLENGVEVAYMQHNRLYVREIEVVNRLIIGNSGVGYTTIETSDKGVSATWHS